MKCTFQLCVIVAFFAVVRLSSVIHGEPQQVFISGDHPNSVQFAPVSLKIHLREVAAISRSSHLQSSRSLLVMWLIVLSGDVEVNPGPSTVKFPCKVCSKPVRRNQRGVQCDVCDEWLHTRCVGISNAQYSELKQSDDPWCCTCCLGEALPFHGVSNSNLPLNETADSIVDTSWILHTSDFDDIAEKATQPFDSPSPLLDCRSSIILCHLNAQSVLNKIDEVRTALLDAKRPAILGISETWLNNTITDGEVSISSFTLYRKDRKGKRGGGIMVYVHNSRRCRCRDDLENDDIEAIWLELHLRSRTILLCNVYQPPSSDVSSLSSIINMVEAATSKGKEVVVMGDLNCNLLSCNRLGDELKSGMENLLLTQLITEPTRVTQSS